VLLLKKAVYGVQVPILVGTGRHMSPALIWMSMEIPF